MKRHRIFFSIIIAVVSISLWAFAGHADGVTLAGLGASLFTPNPTCGAQPKNVTAALDLPQFNAMYQANATTSSSKYCQDPVLSEMFLRKVANEMIKCGGAKVDINFFEDAFGWTERAVDAKQVWNHYMCDEDYNVYFGEVSVPASQTADFTATLHRANHSVDGKYSFGAEGFSLLDVDNNKWWSIEAIDKTNDYGHVFTLRPGNVASAAGGIKKYHKYLIVPARFVGGYSCPLPTNTMPQPGYMQAVNPFRLRRDWSVKIDLMRGYQKLLRWSVLWDQDGKKVDAWDTYAADKARRDLQLARNILAFLATPIDNVNIINGTGVTVVDDVHTGFYGYLPTLKYGGGNVLDFDPAIGYNLDADLEPFILSQDALKKANAYNVRHGKAFLARLINSANKMVRNEGLGVDLFPAYERNGDTLRKIGIKGYDWLGFSMMFEEWGALSDSRLLGTQYMSNLAIMTPINGITGPEGTAVPPLEFYQYGNNGETGDYYEMTIDRREIDGCEEIKGYCAQSVMMAVHCPGNHILLNPVIGC